MELGFALHPRTSEHGESPFVWSTLGGIAQATETIRVFTGVTCALIRIHPTIVARPAATVAAMMPGRFSLGVGTGENLNEHVTGPDPEPHLEQIRTFEQAGFTHVYIHQIGENQEEFAEFAARELLPHA